MRQLAAQIVSNPHDTLVVLATWRQWLEAQYSPATVRLYWSCAMRFFARHPIPIDEITEEHVVDFLQQFPFKSSSRRSYYQGMKSLCTWAERRGVIERDPLANVRAPVVYEKEPRALSEGECLAVINAAYERHRYRGAALRLLYYTGARVGEVVTISWSDVSEDRVILHGHKTGKDRIIEMTPGLKDSLAELWEYFGTYQFVLPRTKQTLWEWCRQAGKDAGVEKVHPHLFRSTAATTMLKRGGRIHAVRSILGHGNVKTTMRYVACDSDDRKEALALL